MGKLHAGQRFGKLVVVQNTRDDKKTKSPNLKRRAVFDCDCGTRLTLPTYYVTRLHTPKKSCGCANKGLPTLRKLEYASWYMMNVRCQIPTHIAYKHYGGRGIKVCARWDYHNEGAFANFITDVPPRPSKEYTLDRINPNGHYEKGNVRWATFEEQNQNKRIHQIPATIEPDPEEIPEEVMISESGVETLTSSNDSLVADGK